MYHNNNNNNNNKTHNATIALFVDQILSLVNLGHLPGLLSGLLPVATILLGAAAGPVVLLQDGPRLPVDGDAAEETHGRAPCSGTKRKTPSVRLAI